MLDDRFFYLILLLHRLIQFKYIWLFKFIQSDYDDDDVDDYNIMKVPPA